tara:strand:- start:644 stop:1207 length:564 start_codon:yes stop_codon:yes gene_type:complete
MKIGIAAGHSRDTTGERRYEFNCCIGVADLVARLVKMAGYEVVEPDPSVYNLNNDDALNAKVALFNREAVDLAVEVHLNAGGGDYSTVIYWDNDSNTYSINGRTLADMISQEFDAFEWRNIGGQPQSYFSRSLGFLNYTNMASVITEAGFKDHAEQRDFFESESGQAQHAGRIYLGIERYIHRGRVK